MDSKSNKKPSKIPVPGGTYRRGRSATIADNNTTELVGSTSRSNSLPKSNEVTPRSVGVGATPRFNLTPKTNSAIKYVGGARAKVNTGLGLRAATTSATKIPRIGSIVKKEPPLVDITKPNKVSTLDNESQPKADLTVTKKPLEKVTLIDNDNDTLPVPVAEISLKLTAQDDEPKSDNDLTPRSSAEEKQSAGKSLSSPNKPVMARPIVKQDTAEALIYGDRHNNKQTPRQLNATALPKLTPTKPRSQIQPPTTYFSYAKSSLATSSGRASQLSGSQIKAIVKKENSATATNIPTEDSAVNKTAPQKERQSLKSAYKTATEKTIALPKKIGIKKKLPNINETTDDDFNLGVTLDEIAGNKKMSIDDKTLTSNNIKNILLPNTRTAFGRRCGSSADISVGNRSVRSHPSMDRALNSLSKVISSSGDIDVHFTARERVAENNRIKVFEGMEKKLQACQSEFMTKLESIKKTSPDKIKPEYKFITLVKNNECKFVVNESDQHKMPKNLPVHSVALLKERFKTIMDMSLLTLSNALTNDKTRANVQETHLLMRGEQENRLKEIYQIIDDLQKNSTTTEKEQIIKLEKEIQDAKKCIQCNERKMLELKKKHNETVKVLEREHLHQIEAENSKKDIHINELKKKLRALDKEFITMKTTLNETTRQLETQLDMKKDRTGHDEMDQNEIIKLTEKQNQLKEDQAKLQEEKNKLFEDKINFNLELTNFEKEQESINVMNAKINEQLKISQENVQNLQKKIRECEKKLQDEITEKTQLKATLLRADSRRALSPKNDNSILVEEQAVQIEKLKVIIEQMANSRTDMERDYEELHNECALLRSLQYQLEKSKNKIKDLEAAAAKAERENSSRADLHDNNAKQRRADLEKKHEIEKLKQELTKAHFNIHQLQQQILRDQQLLEVRCELIDSLQNNDTTQRVRLDEMYHQVNDKNITINEISLELQSKTEEFRNLFSTLSNKQIELTHQQHVIKLLEESNARAQMLRVQQEERIARLEEEVSHLKQTVRVYQNHCQHSLLVNYKS